MSCSFLFCAAKTQYIWQFKANFQPYILHLFGFAKWSHANRERFGDSDKWSGNEECECAQMLLRYQHHNRWTWFYAAASIIIVIVRVVIAFYRSLPKRMRKITHTHHLISCAFTRCRWFDALPFTYKWKISSTGFLLAIVKKKLCTKCAHEKKCTIIGSKLSGYLYASEANVEQFEKSCIFKHLLHTKIKRNKRNSEKII